MNLREEILKKQEERCECVLSIRNPTICWRCRQLILLLRELELELELKEENV